MAQHMEVPVSQLRHPGPKATGAPGDLIIPGVKQYILPGMPAPGGEYGHNSAPVQRLEKLIPQAHEVITSGIGGKVTWPEQGVQGATAMVKLADGTKVISKSQDTIRNDRDELAYYVSQAIGANAPAIARVTGHPRDILEDVAPGKMALRYIEDAV